MNPPVREEGSEEPAIETEAMAWLAERDEGFGPGRAEAFAAWVRQDRRHQAAVAELEQVLGQLEGLAEHRDEVNAHFGRIPPPVPASLSRPLAGPPGAWWRPAAWIGAAAALAVGAFLGFRPVPAADAGILHATTSAGYERSRLADGSMLELNHSSSARVRFSAGERRVELESGEAHFEVAHDTARPFVVEAAGVAVRAVGTAFNVRHVPGAVEVTVTEGRVAIGRTTTADGLTGPTSLALQERMVIPVVAGPGGPATPVVERLAAADVRAVLAWQRRVTDFSDTPLAEVVARFNRHHPLRLVVDDPVLAARRIGGVFALDDVEAFVRLLEQDGVIRAERADGIVHLRAP